ncbi:type III secretion protein HrpB7 [Xanthomonas vasicola]|uniref:Type III secretion protein HrpB7 n=2 Tax=Xanthomonas vasicola TaxID=56459 RepID=A0ABD7S8R6_XANVA|nr:type III secretion protein HrpB7 [Xanthomonas vasicola]AZR21352.1 type III secretion protein HrpB7 [Xanthomonas vasicola]KGR45116.1 serine kinase [Xanthomonas vasicola]KGR46106.1 serine kinase [Xanthomonas vasicola]KGR62099.1 serine kinase [Xanthomonas vasicola]MDO6985744.1 type III secretion protein HrpB7 [Xanthomonas vasicola]
MRDRARTWTALQQLKTRRCERMQDRLSECKHALEHCERELARCSEEANACSTRLAAFDTALLEKAGVGGSIDIDTILQHEHFRTVLLDACRASEQAQVAARQSVQSARDELVSVQQAVSKLQAQAQLYEEKAIRARRARQAQRDAAEEEEAIETLVALRSHRAAPGGAR